MTGLALWAHAGPGVRRLFIRLACDGDYRSEDVLVPGYKCVAQRLTVAQALEMAE